MAALLLAVDQDQVGVLINRVHARSADEAIAVCIENFPDIGQTLEEFRVKLVYGWCPEEGPYGQGAWWWWADEATARSESDDVTEVWEVTHA